MGRKSQYSNEFKQEAVSLAKEIGTQKAADKLGVHVTSIRDWMRLLKDNGAPTKKSTEKKTYAELEKEVKRLQKELGYVNEINRVLKKSTAIFSADLMDKKK